MEQTTLNKKTIAQKQCAIVETPVEVVEVVNDNPIAKRACRKIGRLSKEERADVDIQMQEMRLMVGTLLNHFRNAVTRKELDFNQELQLFKECAKYIGYTNAGNKIAEDVGMDSFAMKYLEINTKIRNAGKPLSK